MNARLRLGIDCRRALTAAGLLVSVTFAASSPGAGSTAPWVTRTVHAYRVSMAIDTILGNASRDPKQAPGFDRRVRVIVIEGDAACSEFSRGDIRLRRARSDAARTDLSDPGPLSVRGIRGDA